MTVVIVCYLDEGELAYEKAFPSIDSVIDLPGDVEFNFIVVSTWSDRTLRMLTYRRSNEDDTKEPKVWFMFQDAAVCTVKHGGYTRFNCPEPNTFRELGGTWKIIPKRISE